MKDESTGDRGTRERARALEIRGIRRIRGGKGQGKGKSRAKRRGPGHFGCRVYIFLVVCGSPLGVYTAVQTYSFFAYFRGVMDGVLPTFKSGVQN